jgi:hypothetical protein
MAWEGEAGGRGERGVEGDVESMTADVRRRTFCRGSSISVSDVAMDTSSGGTT